MPIIKNIHYPEVCAERIQLAEEYKKEGALLISLEKAKDKEEARKIKDFLLGVAFAKKGFAFQYKKTVLFSLIEYEDLIEDKSLRGWAW